MAASPGPATYRQNAVAVSDTLVKSGGGVSLGAKSTLITCWVSIGLNARWNSRGSVAATGSTRVILPRLV